MRNHAVRYMFDINEIQKGVRMNTPPRRKGRVFYSWIEIGDIQVEVGDIEDDEDETAIMQQIYAEGMGWLKSRKKQG